VKIKSRIIRNIKQYPSWLIYLLLFILALVPRLVLLDRIPAALSNDELDYIFNAKLLWLTGRGATGVMSPINITSSFPLAELSSLLISPIIGPLPFSLFLSRLPFAVLGAATVILLYSLTKTLLNRQIALFTGVIAVFNPWNIFFSRSAYDAPVTTFFLLVALRLLLVAQKPKIILGATVPLLIAFHGYQAMMIIFPFFVVIALCFSWFVVNQRKYTYQYLAVLFITMAFVIRYLTILPSIPAGSRLSEAITPLDAEIARRVDELRRMIMVKSIAIVYANKFTVFGRESIARFLNAFSPNLLFIHGDAKYLFSIYVYGLFHKLDGLFIIAGIYILARKYRAVSILLLMLLLIAPLPTIISKLPSYASRSYLLGPILIVVAGAGAAAINRYLSTFKYHRGFLAMLFIVYSYQIANFTIGYFAVAPVANSESFNLGARLMTRYASEEITAGKPVAILSGFPVTPWKQYLLYNNALNPDTAIFIQESVKQNSYTYGLFQSVDCMSLDRLNPDATLITEGIHDCNKKINYTADKMIIPQLSDAGSLFQIFNGQTCRKFRLEKFPHDITLGDLLIDRLPTERFCRKYIVEQE